MFLPLRRPALAAAFALALIPSAGSAAPPNQPPATAAAEAAPLDPAYEALIGAMEAGVDQQAAYDGLLTSVAREYAKVPEFAQIEAAKPGFIDAVIAAIRPTMIAYSERVRADYRPAMLAVLARHLTPSEARDVTEVYLSPAGRKVIAGVSRKASADSVLSGIGTAFAEGREADVYEVTRAQVEADIRRTTGAVLSELTPEDFAEFARIAKEKPAILKMQAIRPDITALRTRMENEQPNAEESAKLEEAVVAVVTRTIGG